VLLTHRTTIDPLKQDFLIRILSMIILGFASRLGNARLSEISDFTQNYETFFRKHPKFGAKMQRVYKRADSLFVPIGWLCVDCGLFKKDELKH